ncbi:MAG: hypothetical protein LBP62_03260 [Clostridiales bacterium]|jgi:hypothetical protein|nr:hypothetical protein [Clostridiales bacterium]
MKEKKFITEKDVDDAYKPLLAFLDGMAATAEKISNIETSENSKIAKIAEEMTVNRILKRCGRKVADVVSDKISRPIARDLKSLTPAELEVLTDAVIARRAKAAQEERRLAETAAPASEENNEV